VAAHVTRLADPGQRLRIIPLVILETVIVVLFVLRRPAQIQSRRPLDWAFGLAGSYAPMFMRPGVASGVLAPVGEVLGVVGVSAAVVAVVFLGRSFGIVAANRGLKTGGLYGVVRHPMYGGYLLTYVGYVLSYPSLKNAFLVGGTLAIQVTRALMEERVLANDPLYREYLRRTPWRFIPYVY
jgi:protein-S-isoprenylcysteine O-methyltransferase Ste14